MRLDRIATFLLVVTCLVRFTHAEAVQVSLLGRVTAPAGAVSIENVARISGGDLITRRRISELDLTGNGDTSVRRITKQQVELRILLEGISSAAFQLSGPEAIMIQQPAVVDPLENTDVPEEPFEKVALEFLTPLLAERLGVTPDELEVQLSRPIARGSDDEFTPDMQLKHYLPSRISKDSLTTKVGIHDGSRLVKTITLSLRIRVSQSVLVASRRIESGSEITDDAVTEEVRFVSISDGHSATDEVLGRVARRTILPRQIVLKKDLRPARAAKRQLVVRTRDIVEIIASHKSLRVRVNGAVALQSGAIGDSIRVQNPTSGAVLIAQVVEAGRVRLGL